MSKQKAIICDLDGCLFDHSEYDKYIPAENTPQAWAQYHKDVNNYANMPVNYEISDLIYSYFKKGYSVIFLTAREALGINHKNTWFALKTLFNSWDILLFMRPTGCTLPPEQIKELIYLEIIKNEYDIELVIDDSKTIIEMFKWHGLKTVHYKKGQEILEAV